MTVLIAFCKYIWFAGDVRGLSDVQEIAILEYIECAENRDVMNSNCQFPSIYEEIH